MAKQYVTEVQYDGAKICIGIVTTPPGKLAYGEPADLNNPAGSKAERERMKAAFREGREFTMFYTTGEGTRCMFANKATKSEMEQRINSITEGTRSLPDVPEGVLAADIAKYFGVL